VAFFLPFFRLFLSIEIRNIFTCEAFVKNQKAFL
jgi:hypothetical protein